MATTRTDKLSKKPELRERFARMMMRMLQAQGLDAVEYDEMRFVIKVLDEDGKVKAAVALEKAYEEYSNAEMSERPEIVQRHINTARSAGCKLPALTIQAIPRILPRVSPKTMLEEIEQHNRLQRLVPGDSMMNSMASRSTVPRLNLSSHHCVSLLYDFPTHVVTLQTTNLNGWALTFEEALDIAVKNLRKHSLEKFQELCDGVYASPYADNHDGARLLLMDKVMQECRFKGDPVAFILNRDTLVLTDSSKPSALESAAHLAATTMRESRAYPAFPIVWRDGEWHDFLLNEFEPAYDAFHQIRINSIADIYNRQKQILEMYSERTTDATAIGNCMVLPDPRSEDLQTVTTWTKGVSALLPVTDVLVFVEPEKAESQRVSRCRFAEAVKLLPHLMEQVAIYPDRVLVHDFPTTSELRALEL